MVDEPPRRAPTIRDVARHAGVSKSLVSLALRGDPGVSPERRRLISVSMKELGYEPNRAARALAGTGSGAIGVVLNDLRNPWFVDLLAGLSTALEPSGVAPLLVDSATNLRVGLSSLQLLARQRVDGIVVVGTTGESAGIVEVAPRIPVVLAGTYEPDDIGADVVVNDDVAGARQATEHLLELGHRRVVALRGTGTVGRLRDEGYRGSMRAAGLEGATLSLDVQGTEASGYATARRILQSPDRPTALVAYNDLTAIGALSAAHDLGLESPTDVSVVGYDDTYLSSIRRLSLTTVENGTYDIGQQAARFLLERIAGYPGAGRLHHVDASLVVRETTGPAPNGPLRIARI